MHIWQWKKKGTAIAIISIWTSYFWLPRQFSESSNYFTLTSPNNSDCIWYSITILMEFWHLEILLASFIKLLEVSYLLGEEGKQGLAIFFSKDYVRDSLTRIKWTWGKQILDIFILYLIYIDVLDELSALDVLLTLEVVSWILFKHWSKKGNNEYIMLNKIILVFVLFKSKIE